MKVVIVLLFNLILSFGLYAQEMDSILYWDQNRKLVWEDFQFKEEETVEGYEKAGIYSGFEVKWYKDESLSISIKVEFDKLESWTADTVSTLLLSHEQLHFDINEYFARIMRKYCDEEISKGVTDIDLIYQSIDSLINDCNDYQREYDYHTAHGSDTLRQKEWDNKIDSLLNTMKAYSIEN